jgi:hypothetical protein
VSDREKQLLALLTRDAAIMTRRELGSAVLIEDPGREDKIAHAKKVSEIKRLARVRQERIAAGLTVRKSYRPTGTMAAGEAADGFAAADGRCVVCGRGMDVTERPSRTCSARCGRAARAARKAVINHREASEAHSGGR